MRIYSPKKLTNHTSKKLMVGRLSKFLYKMVPFFRKNHMKNTGRLGTSSVLPPRWKNPSTEVSSCWSVLSLRNMVMWQMTVAMPCMWLHKQVKAKVNFWGEIAEIACFFFFKVSSFRLVKFVNLRGQRYSMTSFVKGLDLWNLGIYSKERYAEE